MEYFLMALVFVLVLILSMLLRAFVRDWLAYKLFEIEGRFSFRALAHIDPVWTIILPFLSFLAGSPLLFGGLREQFVVSSTTNFESKVSVLSFATLLTHFLLSFLGAWMLLNIESGYFGLFARSLFYLNSSLFIFNLIPILPMDMGRVLYYFAPDFIRNIMSRIEPYGFFIILFIIIILSDSFIKLVANYHSLVFSILN